MDDVAPALAVASSDGVSNPKLKETLEVMRRLRAKKAPTAPYEINAESLYRQAEAIFAMREKLAAKDWDAAGEAVEFALDLLGPEEEAPATDPTAFEARTKVSKTEHETRNILRRECVAVRAALDRRTIGLVMERALSHGRLSGYVGAVEVGDISDGQLEKACATCERLARRSDLAADATIDVYLRSGRTLLALRRALRGNRWLDPEPDDEAAAEETRPRQRTQSMQAVQEQVEATARAASADEGSSAMMEVFATKFPQPLCRGEMRLARDDVEDRKRRRGLRKALQPPACVVEWREPAPEHRRKRVALVGCLDDEASKAQLLRLDLTCEAEPVGARLTREAAALLATAHRVAAIRAELARRDWEVFLRLVKTFETDVEARALELRFGAEDGMHLAIRDATALVADEIAFYRAAVVERDQAKARLLKAFGKQLVDDLRDAAQGAELVYVLGPDKDAEKDAEALDALRNLRRAKRALQRRHLANLKDARRAKAELDACAARQREDGDAWPEDARELDLVLQWATFMLASRELAEALAAWPARRVARADGDGDAEDELLFTRPDFLEGLDPRYPTVAPVDVFLDADHDDFVGGLTDDGDEADRADAVKAAVGDAVDALAAAEGAAAFWSVKRLRAALGDARAVLDAVDGAARDVMARRVDVAAAMLLLREAVAGGHWDGLALAQGDAFLDVAADDFDPLFAALAAPLRKRTFRQRAKKRASGLGFLARGEAARRGRASTTQSVLCDLDAGRRAPGARRQSGRGRPRGDGRAPRDHGREGARGSGVPDLPAAMRVAADAVRDAAADASDDGDGGRDEVPADGPAVTFGTQTLNLDAPPAKRVIRFAPEAGAAEDGGGGETEPEKSVARALNAIGSGTAYVRHSPRAVAELTCVRYETLVRECGARLDLAGHLGADLATECLAADKDPKRALGRDCDDVLAALDAMAKAYCQPSRVDDHRHDAGVALRDAKTLLDALELLYEGHGSLPGSYKALQRRASVGALVLSCRHALRDERWHAIDAAVKLVLEAVGDTHTCLQGAREPDGRFRVAPRAHDDVDVYGPEGARRRAEGGRGHRPLRADARGLPAPAGGIGRRGGVGDRRGRPGVSAPRVRARGRWRLCARPPMVVAQLSAAAQQATTLRRAAMGHFAADTESTRQTGLTGIAGRWPRQARSANRLEAILAGPRRFVASTPLDFSDDVTDYAGFDDLFPPGDDDWRAVARGVDEFDRARRRDGNVAGAAAVAAVGRAARVTLLRDDVDPVVLRGRRRASRGSARPTLRAAAGVRVPPAVLEPLRKAAKLDAPDTLDDLDVDWFHLGQLFVATARDADRRADAAERLAALRGVVDMIDRKGFPSRANALRNAAKRGIDSESGASDDDAPIHALRRSAPGAGPPAGLAPGGEPRGPPRRRPDPRAHRARVRVLTC
ncbi:hypothetical protein JL720_14838 [Aureococcus anophagefferens]|nr:hypothetical protein JL720_14838 [Aureococcus anophagefferens]